MKPFQKLFLALCGLAAAASLGAEGDGGTGLTSFKLLRGARPAAMGGAFSAVADDVNSILYNPAGLNELRDVQMTASHLEWLDGIRDDDVALAVPLYGLGAYGLGVTYLYTQDDGRDNFGNSTGSFNDFDFSVQGSLALQLGDNAGVGATYKIYREGYEHDFNMGSAFDVGLRAAFMNRALVLALGGANLGTTAALGENFAPLPITLKAGMAWRPIREWVWDLDYSYEPLNYFQDVRLGTEYGYELSESVTAFFRAGYVMGPANEDGSLAGLSAGLGVKWDSLQLDYAFAPQGDLGYSQRVSLTYDFGQ